ncbi:MAG: hypothetical protein WAM66_10270 [Acidobacteriaceae bacterium]
MDHQWAVNHWLPVLHLLTALFFAWSSNAHEQNVFVPPCLFHIFRFFTGHAPRMAFWMPSFAGAGPGAGGAAAA